MTVVRVVDIVPADRSDDTDLNWQPSIAINPGNANEIVVTAYQEPPNNVGYSYSYDRGQNWQRNFSEPGEQKDQSAGLGASGELYWAVAFKPPTGIATLHVLRASDLATAGPLPEIDTPARPEIDQPYAHVFTHGESAPPDKDRMYVGYIDRSHNSGDSAIATVDVCLDARARRAPDFTQVPIEFRASFPLDGYEVRPAAHSDGKVYVTYKSWLSYHQPNVIADIVVVRDDNWGANGFVDLIDPRDNVPGLRVATNVHIKDPHHLGGQRLDNDLSIAVDPSNSATVYIVWGDDAESHYTLRVRRSLDYGNTWSPGDLLKVADANLAGLAINSDGRVGFIYQKLVSGWWETHFRRTLDNTGQNWDDIILARTPTAGEIADYSRVIAVGKDFYGVFPAWNTPDPANFPATPPTQANPNGARFLRNTSKTAPWQVLGSNGLPVDESVDPFFYMVQDESTPDPPTNLVGTVH